MWCCVSSWVTIYSFNLWNHFNSCLQILVVENLHFRWWYSDFTTAWLVQINITNMCNSTWCPSKLWQTCMTMTRRLGITGTSEGRNVKNLTNSTTTTKECHVPEVLWKTCLEVGRDHRVRPSEVFLIDESRPDRASDSESGPTHSKHSLMEGSNPGRHTHGCRQTHT